MKKNTKKMVLTISAIVGVIVFLVLIAYNLFGKQHFAKHKIDHKNGHTVVIDTGSDKSDKRTRVLEKEALVLAKATTNDIIMGNKDAPITFIEYASLSCPHCASFYSDGFAKLKAEYIDTNKVKFIYRDFPLNRPALTAAALALCQVNDRNTDSEKYYDFIKALFKTQESWAFVENFNEKLETIAKLDGISTEKFNSCIKDIKLQQSILKARVDAAKILQIQSTPTFIINGEVINGYGGYEEIKMLIDKKLSDAANPAVNNKASVTTIDVPVNTTKAGQ